MKKIDEGYDNLLNSNYELYSVQLFELRDLIKSWYKNVNFKDFDRRIDNSDWNEKNLQHKNNEYIQMKISGIVCNYFFAYRENDSMFLLDGYNRLLTDYGKLEIDSTVYLKVLIDKLEDYQLMSILFILNMWKLNNNKLFGFQVNDFLDRGLRLFLFIKFGINLYHEDYSVRERSKNDIDVLDFYFRMETEGCGWYKMNYDEVFRLFSQKNIINDLNEIVNSNNYKIPPFRNYDSFLEGFVMFLCWRRVIGDNGEYKYQTYLDKLYEDKKFFNKLKEMSGNDSTRKNIYNFFRNLTK